MNLIYGEENLVQKKVRSVPVIDPVQEWLEFIFNNGLNLLLSELL